MQSRPAHRASRLALALLLGGLTAAAHADLPDFKSIIRANQASVVNISTTQKPAADGLRSDPYAFGPAPPGFEEFFRRFREPPGQGQRQAHALGSGFIISPDGRILTNAHVIDGASSIVVKLADNSEKPARVLGIDKATDVALLQIDARGLPAVRLGDSSKVEVGDWVLAIGSPFGLEHSATQGIVSAVGRSLPDGNYVPFIQTDVAVNPGNSGGPLFNTRGEVIGINSQIYSRSGGYMGLSFAIPANVATGVAQQLAATGTVERGWLGLGIQGMNADLARSFGLSRPKGALVGEVNAEGPAAKAGIRPGDVIIAFNGREIADSAALPPLVGETRPGSRATVTVWRDKREQIIPVTVARLGPPPGETTLAANPEAARGGVLNLQVAPLTPAQRSESGIDGAGVLVVGVGEGPAATAGIEAGDIILQLAGEPIATPAELAGVARQLPRDEPVAILVKRRDGRLFLPLTVTS
jgi:serine protease Do